MQIVVSGSVPFDLFDRRVLVTGSLDWMDNVRKRITLSTKGANTVAGGIKVSRA